MASVKLPKSEKAKRTKIATKGQTVGTPGATDTVAPEPVLSH